jgi:transcription antitermination protein NusB
MQSIYAYRQAERSDYQLALDLINETFAPDLNSPTPQDLKKLEGYRKLGSILFEESVQKGQISADEEVPKPVHETVTKAIQFYHNQIRKDQNFLGKQMITDAEKIYDRYLWLLLLLIELADYVQQEEEERQHRQMRPQAASKRELKFHHNRVVQRLKEHQPLEKEAIRRGLNWGAERAFVKELYKEVIKKDPAYIEYIQLAEANFEEDKKIVSHIIKNIIFKHELSSNFFQMLDLSWPENKDVLKSMVTKTIKNIEEDNPASLELLDLAINWEDDRDFFADLYKYTIENDEQYEEMVSSKTKNWDVERVAALDKILLKMAIAEIMHFPSIPVKVTINEYIELSKVYSTPKSKQFVNGMLDAISAELTTKGLVKKSGRGLIDNK